MPLRLSMIAPLPPYRGGIAQFATCSWEALEAAGHQVQPVSFTRQYPQMLFPGRSQYDPTAQSTPGPVLRRIDSIAPWTWFQTARLIADSSPDLMFFHHWMPFFAPAYGTILRRTRRLRPQTRTFTLVHNAIPHERRPFDARLNHWFMSQCDGFIVLSEEVERDLWLLGLRQPVRRIHHPIYDRFGRPPSREVARDRLGIAPETPLILFFGYVRAYKGLDVLLDAVAEVRTRIPEVRLIVGGEFYEDESGYRDQIARLGIARAVELRNEYLAEPDVATLFAACDVVVQPYLSATQSGVAQVAFHFEKPMILTDVGGLAEIVQDGKAGLVVPPGDPDALADAITQFFDEHLADRLIGGVRARKAEFSWDRVVEALEDLAEGAS
jgi:D-inositol-3-phosphate glycosyltransferase